MAEKRAARKQKKKLEHRDYGEETLCSDIAHTRVKEDIRRRHNSRFCSAAFPHFFHFNVLPRFAFKYLLLQLRLLY